MTLCFFQRCRAAAMAAFLYMSMAYAFIASPCSNSFTSAAFMAAAAHEFSSYNTSVSAALMAFKDAITSDPTAFLQPWDSIANPDYCTWPGISCSTAQTSSSASQAVVSSMALDSLGLQGTLSPSIAALSPHLTFLNVSNNSFHGSISADLILSLCSSPSFTHLDLSTNSFAGTVPSSLAYCTSSLQYLDIAHNSLNITPQFSAFLANFSSLVYLDLSDNAIAGGLPASLGRLCGSLRILRIRSAGLNGTITTSIFANCSRLEMIDLSSNSLSGAMPDPVPSTVQELQLQRNAFTGSIPSSWGNCTFLNLLDVSGNSLTGTLPASLGNMASLQQLRIFSNRLSGPFPAAIFNCSKLLSLKAGYNDFSGTIPQEIGLLQQAVWISFFSNPKLSGSIPDSIANCSELQHLGLYDTALSGPLPPSLFHLSKLQALVLNSANFSGTLISDQIANLTSLRNLDLSSNSFHGTIPAGLGRLKNLQGLELQRNQFEGQIPEELSGCATLFVIDMSDNSLTGTIPASFASLVFLTELSLQDNFLSGELPSVLGALTALQTLNLARNNFSGGLPVTLSNVTSIGRELDLSFNRLSGFIPSSLGEFQMLMSLSLAGNNFTGQIPEALGDCAGMLYMDLSMNRLQGQIPASFAQMRGLQYLNLSQNKLSGSLPSFFKELPDIVLVNVSYNDFQGQIPDIELFRNSSSSAFIGNPDLCGDPLPTTCDVNTSSKKSNKATVVSAAVLAIAAVIVACLFFLYRRHKKSSAAMGESSEFEAGVGKQWSAREIRAMTNGFDKANIIGRGGTSTCYKAVIQQKVRSKKKTKGTVEVAVVKRLATDMATGRGGTEIRKSFENEMKTICKMRHRNLVKVLGYCREEGGEALVMEYMEGGDLDSRLYRSGEEGEMAMAMVWEERMSVAMDVAEALLYLHRDFGHQPVVHCDIKPKNILLSSDMVAKLSDFGIAKLVSHGDMAATMSKLRGSFGYVAPEYATRLLISTKADVYSYGVLLLELVTGKRPTSVVVQESGHDIRAWVLAHLREDNIGLVIDNELHRGAHMKKEALSQMRSMLDLGVCCCSKLPEDRPSMAVVCHALHTIVNNGNSS